MRQLDRLGEKGLRSGLHRAHRVRHVTMTGDHDDDRPVLTYALEHLEATHVRQAQVEQDQIRVRTLDGSNALLAAVGAHHLVPQAFEVGRERRGNRLLVVDDQYAGHVSMQGGRRSRGIMDAPSWLVQTAGVVGAVPAIVPRAVRLRSRAASCPEAPRQPARAAAGRSRPECACHYGTASPHPS